jgi:hypothetical protein
MLAFSVSAPTQDRADGGKGGAGLKGLHPLDLFNPGGQPEL